MMASTRAKILKLTPEVKVFLTQAIADVLRDPDFGLELSETAKRRLRQARRRSSNDIPLELVKRKYLT